MPESARTWIGYVAMCVGMFMAILDIQVVASSLTTIQSALHIPRDQLSWIQTAYLMAEIIAIPLTAMLTRALSLRWLFALATVGFTLASFACAFAPDANVLIAIRVTQGFCGGMLIPSVFTSVFTLLPPEREILGTTIAGVFAMIAPTLGPAVGGYLTETFSWHWIFLINVFPGVVVSALVALCVRAEKPDFGVFRHIAYGTVVLASVFLASLELLLKEAPQRHWSGEFVWVLIAICPITGLLAVYSCLARRHPFIDLRKFRNVSFAVGSGLSFVLGAGLYGATYLLAIYLGLVRYHSALEIGEIMMVAGAVQLLAAPLAAYAEKRFDARILIFIGYGLFAAGLIANGFATFHTDFGGLFWPQVLRGLSVMLCLLPATRLALDGWPKAQLPDASAQFNLMRNLGGAIGIAGIDTILDQRTAGHASALIKRLQAGDPLAAKIVGLPAKMFHNTAMAPVDEATREMIAPMVKRAALVQSFNEAWLAIGILFVLSLLALPLLRGTRIKPAANQS
ncbi:MAG TPA: DHA2 family efflux MFS transporter permease subunit [Rhizomicrobium sp.]|nr:DHA2 family efflux MFS transporter permease subunit [Rhizomicrobium sp.]